MNEWKFYDQKKPEKEGYYYVVGINFAFSTPLVGEFIAYYDINGFEEVDSEVLSWREIDYPKMPSLEELMKHGLADRLLNNVEVSEP